MSETDRVAIIGAGQLGSRHMQAMALSKRPTEVTVIDSSEESLQIAKKRWEEMGSNPLVKNCSFSSSMENLPAELDAVVVATSSGPRRAVVEELLSRSKVKYLILEKVLFQRLEDYDAIGKLLQEKNVPAWVNCGRRMTGFYKKLRDLLVSEQRVSMSVAGGNWGIGCNAIHMLDIYAFLTEQKEFKANAIHLDDGTIDSKRKGYIEFTGELRIESSKGVLSLTSYKESIRPVAISINSEHFHIEIDERNQSARILRQMGDDWKWEKWQIDGRLQSRVTQELVQELMETGNCGLTAYEESVGLHKVLLGAFMDHLSIGAKERCSICPIT